ncbi:beta-glucan synthesis-associated protein [Paraconiothyrium brasiliense]|uniref:Beta-glucan synthesis-associated protein n=1 Tax=Paraconiothyrium brasiliense TaxID=300254 RepID=A0ABR3RU63_9PLEO
MVQNQSNLPVQARRSSSASCAERAPATLNGEEARAWQGSMSVTDDRPRSLHEQGKRSSFDSQIQRTSTPPPDEVLQSRIDCAQTGSDTADNSRGSSECKTASDPGAKAGPSVSASQHTPDSPVRRRPQSRAQVQSALGRAAQASTDLQRFGSSLTVHDLGTDYSRYYDPFTDSWKTSFAGTYSRPSSHLSRSNAHATATATGSTNTFLTPSASTTNLVGNIHAEEKVFLIDDRLGAPYEEKGGLEWPLWGDEAEDDDAMHLPHPDDDKLFKIHWKEWFSRKHIIPTTGVILMMVGLFIIFIALPVLAYTGVLHYLAGYETPLDNYPRKEDWAWVNDIAYPLFHHIRSGLLDPDTPAHAMRKMGEFGDEYELVFSDEFNSNNRTFYDGDDPYFFAPDVWYGATQDLEWYDPDAVTTWDGVLELRLDRFRNHGLEFRSGMLNSWNHLCFKGGIFEVSMSLPGPAGIHGLWPGVWTLGNLGRPGYMSTTDGTWPYTYQACDVGITPNQSSLDGLSWLPGQRLPSCTCPSEDHPTPGTGRGAPEIDVAEVSVSYNEGKLPVATQSYQVAPFDIWYYPNYEFTAFPNQRLSYTNTYTGGPFQQAISATTNLNHDWYDGKAYQRFSFEYVPGDKEGSHITWKVGGQTMFTIDGRALGPNGNIQARQISQEPMSLVLNLGISNSWTWVNWEELIFPTVLRVDYVRWYQKKGENLVTCDPPGFETTKYIKEHIHAYTNPNFTVSSLDSIH